MTVDLSPPKATPIALRQGDQGRGTWALQRALTDLGHRLVADGIFGPRTQDAVAAFQRASSITADGIAGPITQAAIARALTLTDEAKYLLPPELVRSIIDGESGAKIAAVNWSVAGGVDCGYTQRRIYGPPFTLEQVNTAFDSGWQITLLIRSLRERFDRFREAPRVAERDDADEYAWRLAVLNHNWPYGASRLAAGQPLSDATASWVPLGTRFDDGTPVRSYADWARWYSIGSPEHKHRGRMVRFVTQWTP